MSVLKVNSFQNTGGTTALTFGNPRMEPNRLVLPVVTNATLPPASSTEMGEIYFNDSDDKLYISKGDGTYQVKSSFSQPVGTLEYGWSSSTANSTTSQGHPINVYYRRNIFQTVYDTSDLSSVEDGAIFRNLKHYVTNAISNTYSARGLNIRLFHTTASKGSDASPISGESKTTVYSVGNTTDVSQWQSTGEQTFTFSTPFEWNGENNICIEYCTAQNQNRWFADGQARVVNDTGSRYRRTDSSGSSCSDTPNSTVNQRPAIKMDYF